MVEVLELFLIREDLHRKKRERERERERDVVWSVLGFSCVCFEFRMSTCFQATGDLISPHFPIFNIYIYTCCSFFFFFFTLFSYMINTILDIYYKFILLNCRILLVLQLNPYLFVL